MTTNQITKAQAILDATRKEVGYAGQAGAIYTDLTVREQAVAHTGAGSRLYEIALFQTLADDLGDIDTDATDEDADTIIEITIEHVNSALGTVKYGPANTQPLTYPLDTDGYANALSYVHTLNEWNAARSFAGIMNSLLESQAVA
jgi:hypothetical protein